MDNKLEDEVDFELIEKEEKKEDLSEITALNRWQFLQTVKGDKHTDRTKTEAQNIAFVSMNLDLLMLVISLFIGSSYPQIDYWLCCGITFVTAFACLRQNSYTSRERALDFLQVLNVLLIFAWFGPSDNDKKHFWEGLHVALFSEGTDYKLIVLGIRIAIVAVSSWLMNQERAARLEGLLELAEEAAGYHRITRPESSPTDASDKDSDDEIDVDADDFTFASSEPSFFVELTLTPGNVDILLTQFCDEDPVSIQSLVPRGSAEKCGKLKPGMELVSINDNDFGGSIDIACDMLEKIDGVARLEVKNNALLEKIVKNLVEHY